MEKKENVDPLLIDALNVDSLRRQTKSPAKSDEHKFTHPSSVLNSQSVKRNHQIMPSQQSKLNQEIMQSHSEVTKKLDIQSNSTNGFQMKSQRPRNTVESKRVLRDDLPIESTFKLTNERKLINEKLVDDDIFKSSFFDDSMNDVPIYESSKSIEEIEKDLNRTEQPVSLKKPVQFKEWSVSREFQNNDEAKAAIITEKIWSQCRKKVTVEGTKLYYRCNLVKLRGQQCAAGLYQLFKGDSDAIIEYRTNAAHDHYKIIDETNIEKKNAMRREVERLIDLGVKPINIMHALSKIDGIELPTKPQLTTMIAAIRKRKFGPATISMGDLSNWLEKHSEVPEEMHKAFVLCHEVDMEAKDPYFRFMITTKHLLSQTELRDFSHADTTYKLIWQGFPVFMVGTTDWDKAYHPYALCVCTNEKTEDFNFVFEGLKNGTKNVLGFEMKQNAIVCDAASAISNAFLATFGDDTLVIMCWFHAKEAIEWELKTVKEKNQAEILNDIEYLHIASNATIFNNGVDLFLLKWKPQETDFCEYFEKVWIKDHPNWFIGAADYVPCHNNALESSNRYLKENHTFRVRYPLPQFLRVAIETVEKWYNQYIIGLKKFSLQPTVSLKLWTDSYNWARSNIPTKIVSKNKEMIIVEVEAEVVRAIKSNKRGVVVPMVSSSQSSSQNNQMVNMDLEQLFELEETEVVAAKRKAKRRVVAAVSKSQLSSQELVPAKKTVKRRRVVAKVSEESNQDELQSSSVIVEAKVVTKVTDESNQGVQQSSSQIVNAKVVDTVSEASQQEASSKSNPENFEGYKHSFFKWATTLVKGNVLYDSHCNCPAYGTEYICKHIVGLAIRFKLVSAPPEAKTIPIGQKRKRGRPSKTKPALMIQ